MQVKKEALVDKNLNVVGVDLLTVKEALKLPVEILAHRDRYWLKDQGNDFYHVADVWADGVVNEAGINSYHINTVLRPVLVLEDLDQSDFEIGDYFWFADLRWLIINEEHAFCMQDLGHHNFNGDNTIATANQYEYSDAKKFLDKWWSEKGKK